MKHVVVPLIPGMLFLHGCVSSTFKYVPPIEGKVENTKRVARQFDVVWDNLVRQLSSDFFVINNIDKNSRLINLSFSAQRPSQYVDCGQTFRTFTNARGEQQYSYDTADSARFVATNKSNDAFNVVRTTKLEGRTNIYVAPESAGTLVSVNTRYVVSVRTEATRFNGQYGGSQNVEFVFSTKDGYTSDSVRCESRGVIERRILNFAGE